MFYSLVSFFSQTSLYDAVKDGVLFAKLINLVEPGTVDERALNTKPNLSTYHMIENNNLMIKAAKNIGATINVEKIECSGVGLIRRIVSLCCHVPLAPGCSLVNIRATNMMEGTQHLVLGVAWQIIRKSLLSNISLKNHPELFRLLEDGESLEALSRLPQETILMRSC